MLVYLSLYLAFFIGVLIFKFFQTSLVAQAILLSPLVFEKDIKNLGYKNVKKGLLYGSLSLPVWLLFPPSFSCWGVVLNNLGVAVAEETFFRGFMMKKLNNVAVSVLFALPHVVLYQNLASVLTFFPSLIFGWVYLRSGSILTPIIFHWVFNLSYFSLMEKFPILYRSVL